MITEEIKNIRSDENELKKFGKAVGLVILIIGIVLMVYSNKLFPIFVATGTFFIISSYLSPSILLPFQKIWMVIAVILGFIMTRIILSVLFYIVISPINFISKIFGKDFLDLKIQKEKKSYWNLKEEKYEKSSTEKQF